MIKIALLWVCEAVIVLGYLRYATGHGGVGLLMHLVLVVALELLCVLPFTLLNPERNARPASRTLLAVLLASVQFVLLVSYTVLVAGYCSWGELPDRGVVELSLRQMPGSLAAVGVAPAVVYVILLLVWFAMVLCYRPASYALLAHLDSYQTTMLSLHQTGTIQSNIQCPIFIFLGCLGALYLPTRSLWRPREPLHLLCFTNPSPYAHMMPAGFIAIGQNIEEPTVTLPVFRADSTAKNLILITVDALRSDQMGVYGSEFDDTPFLSSLLNAGKLKRVDSAYSICTFSFCGLLGIQSSAYWHELTPRSILLSDVLHQYGYKTRYLLVGDHIHFSKLRQIYGSHLDEYKDGSMAGSDRVNDDQIVLPWLRQITWKQDQPTFLDVHLMSVHALGVRQPQYARWNPHLTSVAQLLNGTPLAKLYKNNYVNGILQADDTIRQIFEVLKESGILEKSFIVISADHGESLGEHDYFGHGREPYESTVRIPLLIYEQSRTPYPQRLLTSQVDIAPTLLCAIGAPVPSSWSGIPLQVQTSRDAVPIASFETSGVVAQWGQNRYKYFKDRKNGEEHLFSLQTQEGELTDLAHKPEAQTILSEMRSLHNQLTMPRSK